MKFPDNKPYEKGWNSFFQLFDVDQNPYTFIQDEVSAFDWQKGWQDAAEESDTWNYDL